MENNPFISVRWTLAFTFCFCEASLLFFKNTEFDVIEIVSQKIFRRAYLLFVIQFHVNLLFAYNQEIGWYFGT